MKLDRFRGAPVVMGVAALVAGGAGAATAQSPLAAATKASSSVSVSRAASEPTSPDTDNVQSGDQTTPDGAETTTEEPTTPDTDNIQSGDQSRPDGAAASNTSRKTAGAAKVHTAAYHRNAKATAATGETPGETSGETEAPSDGPGGHEDPAGQNVDHQFQGEE